VIATNLVNEFNNLASLVTPTANPVLAVSTGNVITLTDQDADTGGYDLTVGASGGVNGSGASNLLIGDNDDLATADIITDFNQNGDDVLDLNLVDGVGGTTGNYAYDTGSDTYVDAYTAANDAMDGSTITTSLRSKPLKMRRTWSKVCSKPVTRLVCSSSTPMPTEMPMVCSS